jgi:hypothetical protein
MLNTEIVKRAEALAEQSGGHWSKYIDAARAEASPLQQVVRKPADDGEMRKAAAIAQARRGPGTGDPDPDRRIEIGEVETELGRVNVAVLRDELRVHGVHVPLSDIDADLRGAIISTSSAFAAAERDEEQTSQRAILAIIIDGVLRRHKFLDAKVREALTRQRYDI